MEFTSARILIVDDNQDIHEDIKNILNPVGVNLQDWETRMLKDELFGSDDPSSNKNGKPLNISYWIDDAYQGEEAIQMIRKAEEENSSYSLVFMDVRMPPGMDGIQTIEKIWGINPYTEIVICTAYSDYTWDQILFKLGQTDHLLFIKKPFDSVSVKQIALALTTKWNLERLNRSHIQNLEIEVKKQTQDLENMVEKLTAEIHLRKEKEEQLLYIANYDTLTGLLNRYSFYQSIYGIINSFGNLAEKKVFYLLFIDIDGFKQVNDLYGHGIGDLLLKEISDRIKAILSEDCYKLKNITGHEDRQKPGVDAIFRLGGDEFTAILDVKDQEKVKQIASKLIESIKNEYFINEHEIQISGSIGISVYPKDSTNGSILLKYADLAMYRAKDSRGIFEFFDKSKDSVFIQQLTLEKDLKTALSNQEIELEYQSLLNNKQEIIGIEALVRWSHPTMGVLRPDDFLCVAEKSNLIIKIGEYVLKTACKHLKKLHEAGYKGWFVLVNCTIKQYYDPNFSRTVNQALAEADLSPEFLKLGFEEKFSLQDTERSLAIINELTKDGIQFTIDSLGKGKSMLNLLQRLPRNTIVKIDKTYVENITQNPSDKDFLLILLDLMRSRNLDVIVSGIETQEQLALLHSKNCIFQGYYFNKPKSFMDFIEDLKKQ
ncbi:MAG: EAL domain-containing protein [Firmicutes bacterium]|nr:EAL domain-containing protein [Bacillota bacterium]